MWALPQEFFATRMGLPLTMVPNYDDYSCQFSYNFEPPPQSEDEAFRTPCFLQCPTKKRHRADQCVATEA